MKNDGYDNMNDDYILVIGDILRSEKTNTKSKQYEIMSLLGKGTFG